MPWHIEKQDDEFCVVKDSDDSVEGCHDTEAEAGDQMAALYASEERANRMDENDRLSPIKRAQEAFTRFQRLFFSLLESRERAWDGSASRYESTDQYCSACLIDLNSAAGNEEKVQGYCKLPVKDPGSDSYNFEGIQAAAGALAGARTSMTKPDGVLDEDWDSALKSAANTVISQYNANDETAPDSVYEVAGKEPPEERGIGMSHIFYAVDSALWNMPDWPYLHDIYLEDDGEMFAIVSSKGKLMRMPFTLDEEGNAEMGEGQEIDLSATRTKTQVFRQADGQYRWFSISCTAILNRVGEIDSTALFDSFIAHAQETGEYPYRCFHHLGEQFRTGQADFLARDGYTYITSGLFDNPEENDLAKAEIEARERESEYYGESIGYLPTSAPELLEIEGVKIPVYASGVNTEISTLAEHRAAAWFTTTVQEVTRMRDEIKEELAHLFGGDLERMEAFVAQVDETNREITDEEMIARAQGEIETDTETGTETEPDTEAPEKDLEIEVDEGILETVADRTVEILTPMLDTLTATVEAIGRQVEELVSTTSALEQRVSQNDLKADKRLRELEREEDDKLDELVNDMPPRSKLRITYRPRHGDLPGNDGQPESLAERAEAIPWPDKK